MKEKLQKVLARAGLGSRREMERWIEAGRIKVNREVAKLGERVDDHDQIRVDGRAISSRSLQGPKRRVIVYNKSIGEVTTRSDPEGRKTVFDNLPQMHNGRWITIGRLDINTAGLLIFTNDGELANRLMHPSSEIEREYAVRVLGEVTPEMIQRLSDGVELDDGKAHFDSIVNASRGTNSEAANCWYHVTLKEGKNREVRRLWESQGLQVSRLSRVRYGPVILPRALRQGKWEELTPQQILPLLNVTGLNVVEEKEEKKEKLKLPHKGKSGHKRTISKRSRSSAGNKQR